MRAAWARVEGATLQGLGDNRCAEQDALEKSCCAPRPRCTPLPLCSDALGRGAVRCLIWEAAATLETYLFYGIVS